MSRPGETIVGHRDLHRGGDQGTVFRHGLPTLSVPPMSNNISDPSTSSYPPANARQRPQPPNRSHTSSESPPPDPEPSAATIATQPITAEMDHDGIDQDDSKLELKMRRCHHPIHHIMTRSRTGGVPSSRKQGSTSTEEVIDLLDDDDDEEKTKNVAAAANGDDTLEPQSKVARRADTDASDSTKRQTEQKGDSDDAKGGTVLVEYPKEKKGAVTFHRHDLLALADGQWLNDTAIDIYLKYLLHERLPESVRVKVFVFTTFFWSRLTSTSQTNDRHGPVSLPADAPTTKRQVESIARYNGVKSWTKDVDLFSKDFIVVPINWKNHWFLVIMCYAGYVNDSSDNKGTLKKPSTPNAPPPSNSDKTPPQPCIVLFDSLNPRASGPGSGGYGAVTTLRDYLSMEWLHRHHDKRLKVFDKNSMKAHYPKCPQQSNTFDCGVFLLHYAEKFLSDPPRIFTMKAYDSQWFAESEVTEKRQLIRKLIRNLSDEYYTQRQQQPLSDAAFALPDDAQTRELDKKYGGGRCLSPHTTFAGCSSSNPSSTVSTEMTATGEDRSTVDQNGTKLDAGSESETSPNASAENAVETEIDEVQKLQDEYGLPIRDIFRKALAFYRERERNGGEAGSLGYWDRVQLMALSKQSVNGRFDAAKHDDAGFFDLIGNDRCRAWEALGDLKKELAMSQFVSLLDRVCPPFKELLENDKHQLLEEQRKRLEEIELQEQQRRILPSTADSPQRTEQDKQRFEAQKKQIQEALNQQTHHQFRAYAEQQCPGAPEQQEVLISQLQEQHYQQYMAQVYAQQSQQNHTQQLQHRPPHAQQQQTMATTTDNSGQQPMCHVTPASEKLSLSDAVVDDDEERVANASDDDEDAPSNPAIAPASMWTRKDVKDFKEAIKKEGSEGVIKVGHGETVTVRVPTHEEGTCLFWEFATDHYDIGFGLYFEWSTVDSNTVSVHISESSDEEELGDDDNPSNGKSGGDPEVGSPQKEAKADKPQIDEIIPIYRRDCHEEVYAGSHVYPGSGVYLLKFDNSYSLWRSKQLHYRVYYSK